MPLLQLSENQDAHVLSQSFLVDGREIEVFKLHAITNFNNLLLNTTLT
jgi:hypothetical protein